MKKRIRLTEGQLYRLIREAIDDIMDAQTETEEGIRIIQDNIGPDVDFYYDKDERHALLEKNLAMSDRNVLTGLVSISDEEVKNTLIDGIQNLNRAFKKENGHQYYYGIGFFYDGFGTTNSLITLPISMENVGMDDGPIIHIGNDIGYRFCVEEINVNRAKALLRLKEIVENLDLNDVENALNQNV